MALQTDVELKARSALRAGLRRDALTVLMQAYGNDVVRYCRGLLGDAALAEDTRQRVFIQAYRDLHRVKIGSTFRAWLFGIARHRCADARRSAWRRDARQVGLHPTASDSASPLELGQLLEFCLQELEQHNREAVVLRHVLGHRYSEIEAALGVQAAALQMRVARAMTRLRACVERHGGFA